MCKYCLLYQLITIKYFIFYHTSAITLEYAVKEHILSFRHEIDEIESNDFAAVFLQILVVRATICKQRVIDEGWQQTMASYYHEKSIPYCIENCRPLLPPTHTHTHAHTHVKRL